VCCLNHALLCASSKNVCDSAMLTKMHMQAWSFPAITAAARLENNSEAAAAGRKGPSKALPVHALGLQAEAQTVHAHANCKLSVYYTRAAADLSSACHQLHHPATLTKLSANSRLLAVRPRHVLSVIHNKNNPTRYS
jgi:hypothetical protein